MIAKRPGVTANELRGMLSVEVAECTVCRRLKKLGLTLKKVVDRGGTATSERRRTSPELPNCRAVRSAGSACVS